MKTIENKQFSPKETYADVMKMCLMSGARDGDTIMRRCVCLPYLKDPGDKIEVEAADLGTIKQAVSGTDWGFIDQMKLSNDAKEELFTSISEFVEYFKELK